MPIHQPEVAIQTIDVGIRVDGEAIIVELPQELIGAYLIG